MQVWDNDLGSLATDWGTLCDAVMPDDLVNSSPYTDVGGTYGTASDIETMIQTWQSEGDDYTYDSNTCASTCDNYLQMVWDEALAVGCYKMACTGDTFTCVFSAK